MKTIVGTDENGNHTLYVSEEKSYGIGDRVRVAFGDTDPIDADDAVIIRVYGCEPKYRVELKYNGVEHIVYSNEILGYVVTRKRKVPAKQYVVGFLFNEAADHVLLLIKARPEWQNGKFNGVGGKVEPGEKPVDAMSREFEEETGDKRSHEWNLYATLEGNDKDVNKFQVHYFWATLKRCDSDVISGTSHDLPNDLKAEEPFFAVPVADIYGYGLLHSVPNVRWLIMMAANCIDGEDSRKMFRVMEIAAL